MRASSVRACVTWWVCVRACVRRVCVRACVTACVCVCSRTHLTSPLAPHLPPHPHPTHAGSHVLTVQGLLLRNALLPSKQLLDSGRAAPAPLAFNFSSSSSSSNFSNAGAVSLVLLDCTVSTSCGNLAQFAAWVSELPLGSADVQVGLSVDGHGPASWGFWILRSWILDPKGTCGSWILRSQRGSWMRREHHGSWILRAHD